MTTEPVILEVENLNISFAARYGRVNAVEGLNFKIHRGETLGFVGESGSGKSVTALSLLGLSGHNGGVVNAQSMVFEGTDLGALSEREWRQIRGRKVGTIFQEPMTSLNPVFTVGDQIAEVFRLHAKCSRSRAREQALDMLRKVRIPAPERRLNEFPHQLSGGMRQRVMIAIALACNPLLLIADEPTTALDVTVQAQIMNLIFDLQQQLGMAVLLITHDLAMVAESCDRVAVMYGGRIVEEAPTLQLFKFPNHPYTKALLQSTPRLGRRMERLSTIEGTVPALDEFLPGCRFRSRCPHAFQKCGISEPKLKPVKYNAEHRSACFLNEERDD